VRLASTLDISIFAALWTMLRRNWITGYLVSAAKLHRTLKLRDIEVEGQIYKL